MAKEDLLREKNSIRDIVNEAKKGLAKGDANKGASSSSEEKMTMLQQKLNKEMNTVRFSLFKYSFITDGRINSYGRIFFKVIAFFLSLMYLVTDSNMVEVVTYVSAMTILMPALIDIVTKHIVAKQKIKEDNLYDMLYAFGLYIVTIVPVVALAVFVMKKLKTACPGIYDAFTGFPLWITIAAAVLLAADVVCYFVEKAKKKKRQEVPQS